MHCIIKNIITVFKKQPLSFFINITVAQTTDVSIGPYHLLYHILSHISQQAANPVDFDILPKSVYPARPAAPADGTGVKSLSHLTGDLS
jgi:hypothetical protein